MPFQERAVASHFGARWDPATRAYIYIGATLPPNLAYYASRPYSWERWREDDLNPRSAPPAAIQLQRPAPVTLRSYQLQAVDAVEAAAQAGRPGFLIADELGLGKTFEAVASAIRLGRLTNLVLCPLSVIPAWRAAINALDRRPDARWCVINYDKVLQLLEPPASAAAAVKTKTKNKRTADQGRSLVKWDLTIADEAHRCKEITTLRARALRKLGLSGFVIWMSATAGSTPLELSYLAPALASATGVRVQDLNDFEQWCQTRKISMRRGAYGKWVWEPNPQDLQTMHDLLFGGDVPVGIRRRPEDIAGWPTQERTPMPVELDPTGRQLYDQAWEQFRNDMGLIPRGKRTNSNINALTAKMRYRQKASLLRVDSTVDAAVEFLQQGRQVAISVEWLESLEAIRDGLAAQKVPVSLIHGGIKGDEREAERVRFQRGEAQVVIFTVTEGINLHANEASVQGNNVPRVLIVHDVRYSALASAQIEGRTHRDGQRAPAYYSYLEQTVEQDILKVLIGRLTNMKTMHGDDTSMLAEIDQLLQDLAEV